jgi:LPXTG-motif cell wall-anchored protein
MKLNPDEPEANAVYANMLSHGDQNTTTDVTTVARTIEGLTWMDTNRNGVQEEGEVKLAGVTATLLKLKEGGNPANEADYVATGQSVAVGSQKDVITGVTSFYENGRYKFTNVDAGTYAVRFTGNILMLTASPVNVGDDTLDSDAVPTYAADTSNLQQTLITNLVMPEAEDMSVALFESKYHDSGFDLSPERANFMLPMTGSAFGKILLVIAGVAAVGGAVLISTRKKKQTAN